MPQTSEESGQERLQAFALVGDFIPTLTAEQISMLVGSNVLGGLRLVPLYGITRQDALEGAANAVTQSEGIREPVPATIETLMDFGQAQGYSKGRGRNAWEAVKDILAKQAQEERLSAPGTPPAQKQPYPVLQTVVVGTTEGRKRGVDLWSVHNRLTVSRLGAAAWGGQPKEGVPDPTAHFLAHMTHTMLPLRPDEQLPFQILNGPQAR